MDKMKFISDLYEMAHKVNMLFGGPKEREYTALVTAIVKARELVETHKEDQELNKILYKNIKAHFEKTMAGVDKE